MKYLIFFTYLFCSQSLLGKMSLKDSIRLEEIDSIKLIYRLMTYNRNVTFSMTNFDKKITRLSVAVNGINNEYVLPNLSDSVFKLNITSSGINYDSLMLLMQLMTKNNYCSVGFSGNSANYSIHIGYKFNSFTGREFSYVFIYDDKEKIMADRKRSYVKLKEGIYKTSSIER